MKEEIQVPTAAAAQNEIVPVQRVPHYQRTIFPSKLELSADDLREFYDLLSIANDRAKEIEFRGLDMTKLDSEEAARNLINDYIVLEYDYFQPNGTSEKGITAPDSDAMPTEMQSISISNTSFPRRAANYVPTNAIDVHLAFDKPSLKLDFVSHLSNPTENRSLINIYGFDEDWVRSTESRILDFFSKRKTVRPILHGSGAYDYFLYLIFFPAFLWLFYRFGSGVSNWFETQAIFVNVLFGLYAFILPVLFGHFLFRYFRWLFPPMEYYKSSRWKRNAHRFLAGALVTGCGLSASYDVLKFFLTSLF